MKLSKLAIIIILTLAVFLRFYNYQNHWGLAVDQAHDVLVARYMLESGKIPLLGPFSSAGEFQMSGIWYWVLALITFPYSGSVLTPWIILTCVTVVFVFFMIKFGEELVDKKFGLLLGLFTAVSPAQIAQSVNLTQQSTMMIAPFFALWSAIRYIRTKNPWYLFGTSFFASLGASLHLQGASMIVLILLTFFLGSKITIKKILLLVLGGLIPLTTIFIYDFMHHFWVIGGMSKYYFVDQYRIPLEALGRRWLTYIGVFWPTEWGKVIGGVNIIGGALAIGSLCWFTILVVTKKISREYMITIITLFLAIGMIKYTRTPLFSSYLVALHPLILTASTLVVYWIWKKNKYIGIAIVFIIVGLSIKTSYLDTARSTNTTSLKAKRIVSYLYQTYPKEKFALYDFKYQDALYSLATSMYLDADRRIDDQGKIIAFATRFHPIPIDWKVITIAPDLPLLVEVPPQYKKDLIKPEWNFVTPSGIYHDAVEWKD